MSQDFVRRLPGAGLRDQRSAMIGERVHLDLPMLFLILAYLPMAY